MKKIKVSNELYTIPNMQSSKDGKHWEPTRPVLYAPSFIGRIKHWLGEHISFGQPYCVICGKKEAIE